MSLRGPPPKSVPVVDPRRSPPRRPDAFSGLYTLLDFLADWADWASGELVELRGLFEAQHAALSAPVRLSILTNGQEHPMTSPTAIDVSDQAFDLAVEARDSVGRIATDAGPFTYTVSPPEAAAAGADANFPGDTSHTTITVTAPDAAGAQADFGVSVSDGTLSATALYHPVAGGPTSLTLSVSAT